MPHCPGGPPLPDYLIPAGDGIYAIDTGFHRPRFDAAFLMVHEGRAAFIDTGTNHSVPRLLGALDALGIDRHAVDLIIPTHVHLDHAGGVGLLARELPQARVLVHPRGVRHLVDPTILYRGAWAVYGQTEMERSYGTLVRVPADRIDASTDGMTVQLGGRPLRFIDTPGHARHHHCIWDGLSHGWFTGDTFGLSYREFDTAQGPWIVATTTPVQFEPEKLKASIGRLLAATPKCMYLTHFGRVGDVPRLASMLIRQIDDIVAMARATPRGPQRHAVLKAGLADIYLESMARHGCTVAADEALELLAMDIELNAQGVAIWLDRRA